jgi:hypothetical protein
MYFLYLINTRNMEYINIINKYRKSTPRPTQGCSAEQKKNKYRNDNKQGKDDGSRMS